MFQLIRQLSAGCINIFSAASAKTGIHLILFEMFHELGNHIFFRFREQRIFNRIVFDDIHEIGRNLAVNFYEFVSVFETVVKIPEQDIFESDLVAGLFLEIIQRIDQRADIICIVDGHDLMPLGIVGSV